MTPHEFVKAFLQEGTIDSPGYEQLLAWGVDDFEGFSKKAKLIFQGRGGENHGAIELLQILLQEGSAASGLQKTLDIQMASGLPPLAFFNQFVRPAPKLWSQMLKAGPFIFQNLLRCPELWLEISAPGARERVLESNQFMDHLVNEFRFEVDMDGQDLFAFFRKNYARNILCIGLHEIAQGAAPDITCRAISQLANVICQKSLDSLFGTDGKKAPPDLASRFFILGMGKLGGMELNLSSDIDVIAYYDPIAGDHFQREDHQVFTRLVEQWIQLLTKVTENGFVYRVDLRLRPEGSRGPLVNSSEAGLRYYENWGSLWDRTAYLKARPLAGNLKAALHFLRQLEPFIFQRSVDFKLLDFLFQMKQKIKDEQIKKKRHTPKNVFDVKLDEGGIREIEFFVQMHQLLYGGKELSLRTPSTLPALERMHELKMVTPEAAQDLRDAYLFLRRLENLLQLYDNQQTHLLNPQDPHVHSIIELMGFSRQDLFFSKLESQRHRVHEYFEGFLTERPASSTPTKSHTLGTKGETVFRLLIDHFGKTQATKELLDLLQNAAFSFQTALAPYPDWKRFLNPLEQFFRSAGRLGFLLQKIASEPKIAAVIFDIFYKSDFLTDILLKEPMLALALSRAEHPLTGEEMAKVLAQEMAEANDRGEAMDILRIFCRRHMFRIGQDNLDDQSDAETTGKVQSQLTLLADISISQSAEWINRELSTKYGLPVSEAGVQAQCLVLGLGSLGAEELSFTSDLDLIFVYSANGKTDGQLSISNHEFFTLFAQRLISFLSTATAKGYAYKIDTRLRPSGRAGTLVTRQSSFFDYHQKSKTWEIQSLLRTRVIWGDPFWKSDFQKHMKQTIQGAVDFHQIALDILEMRAKMVGERLEKPHPENNPLSIDIKLSEGGLTDIEFMAQFLQMKLSISENTHTRSLLLQFQKGGVLPPEKIQVLIAAYDRYRFILHQICLLSNHATGSFLFLGMPRLDEIARMLSFDDARSLLVALKENAKDVHRMFLEILQNFA